MHILILGGGVFLGAATLHAALAKGHTLTVFNRGRACSTWPAGVEALNGDRGADLSALRKRSWDAVIDTCGCTPADVQRSAEALRDSGRYLFVSSISAYATTHQVPVRETDAHSASDDIARDDAISASGWSRWSSTARAARSTRPGRSTRRCTTGRRSSQPARPRPPHAG